jgi:hypothetical protein
MRADPSTSVRTKRQPTRPGRSATIILASLIVAGAAAGCADAPDPVSSAAGDATRADSTKQVVATVTLASPSPLATRVTDSCGLAGDAATGSSVTRQYQCGVSVAAFYVWPPGVDAPATVNNMERALNAHACDSSAPVSSQLSEQALTEQTQGPDGPVLEARYLCGDQRVDLLMQRADSPSLQRRADDFSNAVSGEVVRNDPPVHLDELSESSSSDTPGLVPFVVVLTTSRTYVEVPVCEDLTPC